MRIVKLNGKYGIEKIVFFFFRRYYHSGYNQWFSRNAGGSFRDCFSSDLKHIKNVYNWVSAPIVSLSEFEEVMSDEIENS